MVLTLNRWVGKVAVVTGASSGIGASIAKYLVEKGILVVGVARRHEKIEQLAKELSSEKGKLYAVKADITQEQEVVNAFKWVSENVGPVHILINSAGVIKPTSLHNGDAELWKTVLDTNVFGLSVATREAVKIMRANNIDGHIIHINGIFAHQVPNWPDINVVPASKFAVKALAQTLRHEFNSFGAKIKITNLSPGLVETELTTLNPDNKMREKFQNLPILKAEDIAEAVGYVLSTPQRVQINELTITPVGE